MNSFSDWHLVPESRPVIKMPEMKKTTVDIPGRNGVLDISESIRRYPVYNNRTGSLKFHVLNGYYEWIELYRRIANYLHGKKMKVILEDDPGFYYYGRLSLNEWQSNNNGTWSDITIDYDFDPYKYSVSTTLNDAWLWDPFNFYTSFIIGGQLKQIEVNDYSWSKKDLRNIVGKMPLTPKFIVNSSRGIDIRIYNSELGIDVTKKTVTTGTYEWPEIVLSEIDDANNIFIEYRKSSSSNPNSNFSVEYRVGYL